MLMLQTTSLWSEMTPSLTHFLARDAPSLTHSLARDAPQPHQFSGQGCPPASPIPAATVNTKQEIGSKLRAHFIDFTSFRFKDIRRGMQNQQSVDQFTQSSLLPYYVVRRGEIGQTRVYFSVQLVTIWAVVKSKCAVQMSCCCIFNWPIDRFWAAVKYALGQTTACWRLNAEE